MKQSVVIKSSKSGLIVILDEALPFGELEQEVAEKFRTSAKFFKNAQMAVTFRGRNLSQEEELALVQSITQNGEIEIMCVMNEDELTEEAMRQAVENHASVGSQDGKFYKGTLRSGQVLESETSIIILGDVNAGAKVVSKGNVVVLGTLKGTIYVGAAGNEDAFVAALVMDPLQIRIADVIARRADKQLSSKEKKKQEETPKIAYVEDGNIYIEPITREVLNDIRI
ncbi:MAG: septum site-determining protein MinC [Lachnospiraceae bacterium]|nr:septum site-determining protein MinC [Lachnospiraceae bacterium]